MSHFITGITYAIRVGWFTYQAKNWEFYGFVSLQLWL